MINVSQVLSYLLMSTVEVGKIYDKQTLNCQRGCYMQQTSLKFSTKPTIYLLMIITTYIFLK